MVAKSDVFTEGLFEVNWGQIMNFR